MMETLTPEQLQNLTGASNDQIQNMQDEVGNMSDAENPDDDKMSKDVPNDDEVETIDLEDGKLAAAIDNNEQDVIMRETRDTTDVDVFGHMQDDEGNALHNPSIENEDSDAGDDEDMDENHTGIAYSLSRVAGSPPRKKTALWTK